MSTEQARPVIEALVALEVAVPDGAQYPRITQKQGEEIAKMFTNNYGLFCDLDGNPGRFEWIAPIDNWHWKLRQARNNTMQFFDIIEGM